jgi:hypothetical protein
VGLTVSATGTEGGAYCECNRDRGWGLLWVQQGQRYGRMTIGHYSNNRNRHTALYIYIAAQTVSAVQLLCAVHREVGKGVYTLCTTIYTNPILNRSTLTSSCYTEANNKPCTKCSHQWRC